MAKHLTRTPYKAPPVISREEEIEEAIGKIDDIEPESISELCKKIHLAVIKHGFIITKDERESLKLLSMKTIPDAPKEIHIDARVRTETVILDFLNNNLNAQDQNFNRISENITHEIGINSQIIPALVEELGIPE